LKEDAEQAEERRDEDDGETDVAEADAVFDGEDDERPDEVELLLDAERPEMTKLEDGQVAEVKGGMQIFHGLAATKKYAWIEQPCVVAKIDGPETPRRRPDPVKDGIEEKGEEKDTVVEGKDTKDAADVEVAKAMLSFPSVVEDACDEKAGEDEEDVDADPTPAKRAWVIEIVFEEDEKDRNGSQAIECGIEALVFRQGEAGGLLFDTCMQAGS
jgi:hypothetical protein